MHQVKKYDDWLNQVKSLGAGVLLKEVTPNSEFNFYYAELVEDRIIGNWCKHINRGWVYQPMKFSKRYRRFKKAKI